MTIPFDRLRPMAYLTMLNRSMPLAHAELNLGVLDDSKFRYWCGGVHHHHNFDGGLSLHTAEVVHGCSKHMDSAIDSGRPLDWPSLFTAALWHDYGKIWDYERNPEWNEERCRIAPGAEPVKRADGEIIRPWRDCLHRKLVNHVGRSYAEFMMAVQALSVPDASQIRSDLIGHCILAHHGRKEWGSPVEPQLPEAWALHLADQASAKILAHDSKPHE